MPKKLTQEDFIKRAKQVHGDKYDYSKVEYVNSYTKVCIICPEHGEFWQTPLSHLYGGGHGCIDCVNKRPHNKETFIKKSKEIHGDKYDYSKVDNINNKTKVCIICPEHGEFWQTPHSHLQGQGCPYCNFSKLEKEISLSLKENNLVFKSQKTFEWLKDRGNLYLDFYLPDYNIAIECQGIQHFEPCNFGSDKKTAEEMFEYVKECDNRKYELCKENGIKLIYYKQNKLPNWIINKEDYFSRSKLLIEYIKNNGNI